MFGCFKTPGAPTSNAAILDLGNLLQVSYFSLLCVFESMKKKLLLHFILSNELQNIKLYNIYQKYSLT